MRQRRKRGVVGLRIIDKDVRALESLRRFQRAHDGDISGVFLAPFGLLHVPPFYVVKQTNRSPCVQEDLQNAKIPLGYRDYCAHLLVPLNACRRQELYLPWKCEHERHAYEKCEYLEYKRRLKNLKETESKH